jgi:hypothetical protein
VSDARCGKRLRRKNSVSSTKKLTKINHAGTKKSHKSKRSILGKLNLFVINMKIES